MKRYRTGVRQFIILGALAQAPHMALTEAQLYNHFARLRVNIPLSSMLEGLRHRGCIDYDDRLNVWALTEYGAEALCARSRSKPVIFYSLGVSGVLELEEAS